MSTSTMIALRELQRLDRKIRDLVREVEGFDPLLAEVEDPALRLEGELEQLRKRLEQMRQDRRRLERSAEERRERAALLEARQSQVTNLREEAAVRTEVEMVRRALEADERDKFQLLDQIERLEGQEAELESRANAARAEVAPRQAELLERRKGFQGRMASLKDVRQTFIEQLGPTERRVYDSFHSAGRAVVVAVLTDDGACGYCFNVVPLQLQNEIRRGVPLIRCEACGVLLTNEPELPEEAPGDASE
jgi:uncharacterized protein